MAAAYIRNKQMVDLSQTPQDIKDEIVLQYELQKNKGRGDVVEYFNKFNLNRLMESINEF